MRPKTLYVKLLLAFIGVLVVTEILILGLFFGTAGRAFKNNIHRQTVAKLMIFKQNVEDKLTQAPHLTMSENTELVTLLMTFSRLFDLQIWITTSDNQVVLKTGDEIPEISLKKYSARDTYQEGIRLYHLSKRHLAYYAAISMSHNMDSFTLHLYINKEQEKKPEAVFLVGLLSIGGVVALLVFPLARIITRRLADLNQSALDFANGDLNRRTDVQGDDEIAALGKSFNFMADRLEKMIRGNKEMLANISHELRSPLTRIRMSQELVKERIKSESAAEIHKYADHIDQDIDTLDHLIDQILKLSKMDFQNVTPGRERVMLSTLFNDIEARHQPLLRGKNITIVRQMENDLHLDWNRQDLDTIYSNLLDNAVKYSDPNSRVHVRANRTDNNCVLISIANPYRRLTKQQLEDIFRPFHRGDSKNMSGSGLGLTIVKKLLEKNDARITARNSSIGLVFELEFEAK